MQSQQSRHIILIIALLIAVSLVIMLSLLLHRRIGNNTKTTSTHAALLAAKADYDSTSYFMPPEESLHEGTWLQWPHNYGFDRHHIHRYESTWIQMTRELNRGENVHIIAYDMVEKERIKNILASYADIDMNKVSLVIGKTDDVWVRDNGPIFVFDTNKPLGQQLMIQNWSFNGWGYKAEYKHCNNIPILVGNELNLPRIDIDMVNEGGSIELDGRGTLMAKQSSILNKNRNPGWTLDDVESYFRYYLGVRNFIWLKGTKGHDITDDHIDGTARFANGDTIVTYYPNDSDAKEYNIFKNAKDINGSKYSIVHLPVTSKKLRQLRDYGTYINYYVANEVVLVPKYNDPNDGIAIDVIQKLYPSRRVVGVEAIQLAKDGGMIHCVTQQQPLV